MVNLKKWAMFGAFLGLFQLLALTALGSILGGLLLAISPSLFSGVATFLSTGGLAVGGLAVMALVLAVVMAMFWTGLWMAVAGFVSPYVNKVIKSSDHVFKIWAPYSVVSLAVGFVTAPASFFTSILTTILLLVIGYVWIWLFVFSLKMMKKTSLIPDV